VCVFRPIPASDSEMNPATYSDVNPATYSDVDSGHPHVGSGIK